MGRCLEGSSSEDEEVDIETVSEEENMGQALKRMLNVTEGGRVVADRFPTPESSCDEDDEMSVEEGESGTLPDSSSAEGGDAEVRQVEQVVIEHDSGDEVEERESLSGSSLDDQDQRLEGSMESSFESSPSGDDDERRWEVSADGHEDMGEASENGCGENVSVNEGGRMMPTLNEAPNGVFTRANEVTSTTASTSMSVDGEDETRVKGSTDVEGKQKVTSWEVEEINDSSAFLNYLFEQNVPANGDNDVVGVDYLKTRTSQSLGQDSDDDSFGSCSRLEDLADEYSVNKLEQKSVLSSGDDNTIIPSVKKREDISSLPRVPPWNGSTTALNNHGVSITLVPSASSTSPDSSGNPIPSTSAATAVLNTNGTKSTGSSRKSPAPPVLKDYSAKCDACGRLGVKRTFQQKQKNFCSLACSTTMGKKSDANSQGRSNPLASDVEEIDENSSRCSSPADEHGTVRSSSSASNSVNDYDAEGAPKKKKKKVEIDPTFDWKSLADNEDFRAASVGLMKHAPLSRMWDNVTVGMKLEVENKDIEPRNHQVAFWVASVVKIHGYLVLLRFEGFGTDSSGDFWINLCSHDIHHVGWCANKGKPLIPPRSISRKFSDWRNFLVNRLTGARTLPQNFQSKVQASLKSKYEIGDQLEVVDKNRICQLRLATVRRIVGRRLHVEYFDSNEDGGFWCHEESRLIHPKGWAKTIGHEIIAPKNYTPNSLLPTPYDREFEEMDLQVGMKLEAIDPLNLSAICAATIKKVLRRGYVMVRVDCYEEDSNSNGSDWFCYHISSPYVFPCGFCKENQISLTPPYGYEKDGTFSWDEYLSKTKSRAAPVKQKKAINHKFKVGMKVEAADLMDPRLICVATISHIVGRLLKIHFDGWEEEYDQWLDARSPDIYPVGWCELVDHKLEAPRAPPKPIAPVKKGGKKGKKGKATKTTTKPTATSRAAKSPAVASANASVAKKVAGNQKPEPQQPVSTIPSSANPTGPRRSSIQLHTEQLKSAEIRSGTKQHTTAISSSHSSDESVVTSTTSTTVVPPVTPEPEPNTISETLPTSTPVVSVLNGSQSKNDVQKTELDTTGTSFTTGHENNGNRTPSPSSLIDHVIPRLTDNPSCCDNVDPTGWGPQDVVTFLNTNDCGAHSELFQRNKINGQSLLSLTKDQIVILTGMKVGPAVKIADLIGQLKRCIATQDAKARNALVK